MSVLHRTIVRWLARGLVLGAIIFAAMRVRSLHFLDTREGNRIVRFAIVQTDPMVHAAYDAVARACEARRLGIRFEQIIVPERIYPAWLNTRLIGGTAPEITEHFQNQPTAERLAQYFTALSAAMETPNLYNAGTPAATVPWRQTFRDGVATPPAFSTNMMEVYGVPITSLTNRVVYNLDLLRRIGGDPENLPQTWEALLALCARARPLAAEGVVPLAASGDTASQIFSTIIGNETQRLALQMARYPVLRNLPRDFAAAFLRGDWSLEDNGPAAALARVRDLAVCLPPGFLQLSREDGAFWFLQGRALATLCSSIEFRGLRSQVRFPLGVGPLALLPRQPDPGRTIGWASEAEPPRTLILLRESPLRAEALDFLRFLTSQEGQALFVGICGLPPTIHGVAPAGDMTAFSSRRGAAPFNGFDIDHSALPGLRHAFRTSLHALVGATGNAKAFGETYAPLARSGIGEDLRQEQRRLVREFARQDASLAAAGALQRLTGKSFEAERGYFAFAEYQVQRECAVIYWDECMAAAGK